MHRAFKPRPQDLFEHKPPALLHLPIGENPSDGASWPYTLGKGHTHTKGCSVGRIHRRSRNHNGADIAKTTEPMTLTTRLSWTLFNEAMAFGNSGPLNVDHLNFLTATTPP